MLLTWASPLKEPTAEILSRTHPNLFDLLVAAFSGVAGGYAVIRQRGEAVIGVAIAMWTVDLIVAIGPRGLPRLADIAIDGRVLAFTAGLSVLTGIIFGLVPALYSARPEIAQMLRDSGRSSSARRARSRMRAMLVVAEVTLAVVLLVGSGLLIRSYMKLLEVDPGFRAEQVATFSVSVPEGTQAGKQFRLKGKGMPVLRSTQVGDLYIQIQIETPQKLSKRQRELLQEFEQLSSKENNPESTGFFARMKEFFDG